MLLAAFILALPLGLVSEAAIAASVPEGTCTNDPQYNIPTVTPGQGMVSVIVTNIQNILNNVSQLMFTAITGDTGFIDAVNALLTLYIAVYGILFTFGMVQMTLHDFVMRMIKVGIMVLLLSPAAWTFFNNTVITFFNDGTDDLINEFTNIAVGGVSVPSGTPPFAVLDDAIAKAVSAKMAITLMAIFATGPYGVIFGILLLMALGSFMKSALNALWVYLMSLVLKTLLFGIAPLFLCCLLFNRTRHLFDGWLNQIVNASLQPILLFAFFAFFAKLIEASIGNILATPVCWTEWAESVRGTPFAQHFWRFAQWDTNQGTWVPYAGRWSFTGAEYAGAPTFPIDLMTILILLILAELAGRFNHIVIEIAKDLAGAATHLGHFSGGLNEWFSGLSGGGKGGGSGGGGGVPGLGGGHNPILPGGHRLPPGTRLADAGGGGRGAGGYSMDPMITRRSGTSSNDPVA